MKKSTVKSIAFVAAAFFAALPLSATTIKALSFAINETSNCNDETPIQAYMGTSGIDFGVFDHTKKLSYFIDADFTSNGRNFKVANYQGGDYGAYKVIIYDLEKYSLVNSPLEDFSDSNIATVFEDECGDQFALISLRSTKYDASKESATLTPVKTYIERIATKYPKAKLIVTYNARLSSSLADVLNTYLTETSTGPQLTRLGRTSGGGAYMRSADVPESYSVEAVDSIGTSYDGLLTTLTYPTKYKVVFNDWDGTGLQTNIVYAGESVTPPTPQREGYTFTGWDHAASEFASVLESFTATAQYASNAAWLNISGDPENLGTAAPVYGAITEISANDTFTATVSNPAVEEDATERWVCTGYSHYKITDLATGVKTVAQEGNGSSFTYTHVMHDELVWHFTNEWLVTASASVGGSVSAAETWVRNDTEVSLTAIPDDGYSFWRWEGDTDGVADVTAATITPVVTSARSFYATFTPTGVADPSVQYVSTSGDDGYNGYSAEKPKRTVQAAVNTLVATPGYGTVYVAAGTYASSAGIVVTNAIEILGATGNPEGVIIRNTSTSSSANVITLRLNHPDAFVANIAIENGHRYQQSGAPFGANLAIESRGGTVSNCIIRGGSWNGMYVRGLGAWLNSANALLTHCVITNNNASGASQQPGDSGDLAFGGMFVDIAKGTVANCLIANNRDTGGSGTVTNWRQSQTCGVTVRDGGRLLNCTVVTNEARYTGGIYLTAKGVATNVVVAGCVNKCTLLDGDGKPQYTEIGFKGTIDNASHCASDGGEALTDNCVAGTTTAFFRDFAGGDYRPALDSPLINAGIAYEGIASFDLLGKKRVQGRAPDIGCFESAPSGLSVVLR